MSGRVFQVLQQMLQMRKDRSVAKSKMVKAEYDRVRNFNEQIESYATEYESQWIHSAHQGDTVLQLQTQASFGQKLRATAASQQPEIQSLQAQSKLALEKAQQDAERLKTFQNFMASKKRLKQKAQDQADEKALEDVLQARNQSS
jgi:flagellar biosynthesis chaperone FliJ